jgi:hypothetical protein
MTVYECAWGAALTQSESSVRGLRDLHGQGRRACPHCDEPVAVANLIRIGPSGHPTGGDFG